jgi:hypothetical protein
MLRRIWMRKSYILTAILPLCFAQNIYAKIDKFYLPEFYIGADAQVRNMRFEPNYGGNIYKREYPQSNVYIGVKGNEYIGIEAGFV